MNDRTKLELLPRERAEELFNLLQQAQEDESKALALDHQGRVVGAVAADDAQAEHLLHDLDVHA